MASASDLNSGFALVKAKEYEKAYPYFLRAFYSFVDKKEGRGAVNAYNSVLFCRIMLNQTVRLPNILSSNIGGDSGDLSSLNSAIAISDAITALSVKNLMHEIQKLKSQSWLDEPAVILRWSDHLPAILDMLVVYRLHKMARKGDRLNPKKIATSLELDINQVKKMLTDLVRKRQLRWCQKQREYKVNYPSKAVERLSYVAPDTCRSSSFFSNDKSPNKVIFCLLWEYSDCILPVRDQESAKCCYAFVLVDLLYAYLYLQAEKKGETKGVSGEIVRLFKGSEQEMLDRVHLKYDLPSFENHQGIGCYIKTSFKYLESEGLSTDEDLPFMSKCMTFGDFKAVQSRKAYIDLVKKHGPQIFASFEIIEAEDVPEKLNHGPIRASIYPPKDFGQWDEEDKVWGITDLKKEKTDPNKNTQHKTKTDPDENARHAVVIVGHGVYGEGKVFFIIKNSYGKKWGHGGYVKINAEYCFNFYAVQKCELRMS